MKAEVVVVGIDQLRQVIREELARANSGNSHVVAHNNDEYLTQHEATQLLKVTRSTLIRWAKAGKIKVVKIGRTARYNKAELLRMQEAKE